MRDDPLPTRRGESSPKAIARYSFEVYRPHAKSSARMSRRKTADRCPSSGSAGEASAGWFPNAKSGRDHPGHRRRGRPIAAGNHERSCESPSEAANRSRPTSATARKAYKRPNPPFLRTNRPDLIPFKSLLLAHRDRPDTAGPRIPSRRHSLAGWRTSRPRWTTGS